MNFGGVPSQISGDLYYSLVHDKWWHCCGSNVTLLEISKWPSFSLSLHPVEIAFCYTRICWPLKEMQSHVLELGRGPMRYYFDMLWGYYFAKMRGGDSRASGSSSHYDQNAGRVDVLIIGRTN